MALPTRSPRKPSDLAGQANGQLAPVLLRTIPGGGQMHHLAARAFAAMRADADAAGFNLDMTARTSGGAYRTLARQIQMLRERAVAGVPQGGSWSRQWNGQTWYGKKGTAQVATPGNSNHGWGLAIDLALDPDEIAGGPVSSLTQAAINWLVANGPRFGFWHEAQSEPWHMSYGDGDTLPAAVLAFEGTPVADYRQVIDISFHNLAASNYAQIVANIGRVDFAAAARRGCDGVIARMGNANRTPSAPPWDPTRMVDGSFELFVAGYRKAGMRNLMGYWWLSPTVPGKQQATVIRQLWQRVGGVPGGVMLDIEDANRATPLVWKNTIDGIIRHLAGIPVRVIYTGSWWWDSTLAGFHDDWAHLDLIEAEYPRNLDKPPSNAELWDEWALAAAMKGPSVSKGWATWSGWQFTSSADGSDFGFPSNDRLDGNVIKRAAFDRWFNVLPSPTPPSPPTVPFIRKKVSMLFRSLTDPTGAIYLLDGGKVGHIRTAADADLADLVARYGPVVNLAQANVDGFLEDFGA